MCEYNILIYLLEPKIKDINYEKYEVFIGVSITNSDSARNNLDETLKKHIKDYIYYKKTGSNINTNSYKLFEKYGYNNIIIKKLNDYKMVFINKYTILDEIKKTEQKYINQYNNCINKYNNFLPIDI
tara:strand:- start:438 stop:818 length:381 start_codon:yes stop_codon:yes gene_type:complete